jgi:acid phosphatase
MFKWLTTLLVPFLFSSITGCATTLTQAPSAAARTNKSNQSVLPHHAKIVLMILENTNASAAESDQLPFLSRIRKEGAYLSNYHAIAHPSQPNYVALISGSTDGVPGDLSTRLHRPHLGQFLTSWKIYAEGYPKGQCDTRKSIGLYVRRHVPFLSFADVQDNENDICINHISDFKDFIQAAKDNQLPDFSMVIPNLKHDAHDWPIAKADAWLYKQFKPLLDNPRFKKQVIFFVTFDENDTSWPYLIKNNNRVYAAAWGSQVRSGYLSQKPYTHYSLLHTLEALFKIKPMTKWDAQAPIIDDIWLSAERND